LPVAAFVVAAAAGYDSVSAPCGEKTLLALERGKDTRLVVAEKMLHFANRIEVEGKEEKGPEAPVLRDPNPKRPAGLEMGTNSASLTEAKRQKLSNLVANARANKTYHLTVLPTTTTVANIYQEWKYGLLGGIPLFQVDVATQGWKNDPEMRIQYRIRHTISKAKEGARRMHPQRTEIDFAEKLQL
jgi:hypothetical protein